MATKVCTRCKKEMSTAQFIAVDSNLHTGSLPICRQCLSKQIEEAYQKEDGWNTVDKICQWADIPFVPEFWEKTRKGHGKEAIGVYISTFRMKPYDKLDWGMYNRTYLQIQEENRVEDALPSIRENEMNKLRRKWGSNYDDEELEYLENLHLGLISSQNIVGALNEDQALKLCKISLVIENKIRAGADFDKDLRAYDQLSKLANLTSKVVKDGNEFNSVGEVFAYLEKTGWKNPYYDGAIRDEVDFSMKDIKLWLQYLYTNETGVAEEIEHRINQLKAAAELRGGQFDEEEFRRYLKEQENEPVLLEEDFNPVLE